MMTIIKIISACFIAGIELVGILYYIDIIMYYLTKSGSTMYAELPTNYFHSNRSLIMKIIFLFFLIFSIPMGVLAFIITVPVYYFFKVLIILTKED